MAERIAAVRFTGDTSDLERAVARATAGLEEFSDQEIAVARAAAQADKALAEQAKALGLTTSQLKGARSAAEKFAAADRAAMKESADATGKAREAKLELVELLGGPSKDVMDKLSKATSALSPVVLGAAAAFAGAAAGVAIFAGAAFGSVLAADDLARSIMEIKGIGEIEGFGINPEALDAIDTANAAFDALITTAKLGVVQLAERFAPAVTGLSKGLTFLSLAGLETWQTFTSGKTVLEVIGNYIKFVLTESLLAPITAMEALTLGISKLADLAGLDTVAAHAAKVSAQFADIKRSFGGTSVADAITATGAQVVKLAQRTNALTDVMKDKAAADRDAGRASSAAKDADKERAEALKVLEADLKRVGDAQRAANKAAEDAGKATSALLKSSEALGADAPDAVAKLRDEYAELNAAILAQIEANTRAGVSTAALEDERVALAVRARQAITAEEAKIRDANAARLQEQEAAEQAYWLEVTAQAQSAADQIVGAFGDVAGLVSDHFGAALDQTTQRLESIREALAGLQEDGVSAATLTGAALVNAYVSGQVAAEDLSEAQKAMIAAELGAREKAVAEQEAIQKDAAEKAFKVAKAASISQAIMAGAVAVVQALAQLGPIAGAAAAIAIGATTSVQVATIAAQEPTFHAGGFVDAVSAGAAPQAPGYAPDERGARLQTGEAVLSRQGRAALGDDVIRSANAGRAPGAVVNVTQVYDGQVIGRAVQGQLETSSSLRRAVGVSRPGHKIR